MTVMEWIGSVIIALGVLIMVIVTFNIFRLDFVTNRMHITAMADSLGTLLIFFGASLCNGLHPADLKLILILTLQWITSPVCSHMISQLEYAVVHDLEDHAHSAMESGKKEEQV